MSRKRHRPEVAMPCSLYDGRPGQRLAVGNEARKVQPRAVRRTGTARSTEHAHPGREEDAGNLRRREGRHGRAIRASVTIALRREQPAPFHLSNRPDSRRGATDRPRSVLRFGVAQPMGYGVPKTLIGALSRSGRSLPGQNKEPS